VALGIVVVVGAAAMVVPLAVNRPVAGTPVAEKMRADQSPTTAPRCEGAPQLSMSGSPLASGAIDQLDDVYQTACPGTTSSYDPVGTGAGIQEFITGETAMAVADRPLDETERGNAGRRCEIQQLPFVARPVWVLYHLSVAEHLTLDAPTLAKIFSGAITQWNDPAITALNPGAGLGALPITVVGRSTESTVTAAFQQYLTAVGGWTTGAGPAFTGRATQSARTEEEALRLVESTDGAIGYRLSVEGTGTKALWLSGVGAGPSEVLTTVNLALPEKGLELDMEKLYRASEVYPLVIVSYAVFCADDRTTRDYLRSALVTLAGSVAYIFPAYEWATRFGDALQ
jgi:phosphate transport system substrate-binding protein